MVKKGRLRRQRKSKVLRKKKRDDLKFQASLDASYGLTANELRNTVRSYGGSQREAFSIVSKMFGGRRK